MPIEYIKDDHGLVRDNTANRVQIQKNRLLARQYAWSCPVRSRMNRQKVSAVECILCHQRRHRTHLLQDLTVRIDSTIMSTHKLRLIRLEER